VLCSVTKFVLVLFISSALFGRNLTLSNKLGCAVASLGVALFQWARYREQQQQAAALQLQAAVGGLGLDRDRDSINGSGGGGGGLSLDGGSGGAGGSMDLDQSGGEVELQLHPSSHADDSRRLLRAAQR
jgi:hypothetical protein